jgi:alpha-ketoglutarate-dependent taurine dioxygenase
MVAIWDNVATQHLAINDYTGERRDMVRTSVSGPALKRYLPNPS